VAAERVDLVATPPDVATLRDLWRRSGLPLERFFNTSGQSYRDGGFKDRLPSMDDAAKLAALAADGKLVKRPILDASGPVRVGFREAEWAAALGR
jgi:arsenate reductase